VGKATGDYIAHLDGDDFWLPGKLALQLDFLKRWGGCSAVWSNAIVISEHGQLVGQFNGYMPEQFDINYLIEKGNFLNHSSLMYRSVCKEQILRINTDFIDYYICMLLTEYGLLGYINRHLVIYRHGSTSSIIRNNINYIRSLNWQAISCARSLGAGDTFLARGISEFYGSILSSTVKQGKLRELWYWSNKIYDDSQSILAESFVNAVALLPLRVILSKLRKLARRLVQRGINTLFPR
jgi:glycosyltransferase involved in cell wall biosynthesis